MKDLFGKAILDYQTNNSPEDLVTETSISEADEMLVSYLFRTYNEMPELEQKALQLAKGSVLDVGCGAGSHTLELQNERKLDVTAIDISADAVKIMQQRGVKKAVEQDVFLLTEKYDTLLFLMNGIGLTGTLQGFIDFLYKAKNLLNPEGQLLFDSSDISYLYEDSQKPQNKYFGEINYCYEYKKQKGNWFNWLYLDQGTLAHIAHQNGWDLEVIFEDGEDQYLAKLTLIG